MKNGTMVTFMLTNQYDCYVFYKPTSSAASYTVQLVTAVRNGVIQPYTTALLIQSLFFQMYNDNLT